jgi:hypothetical protein
LNNDTKKLFLFNIAKDPEERHELSSQNPEKVNELLLRLEEYNSTAVPVRFPNPDPAANPALHDGEWSPWVTSEHSGVLHANYTCMVAMYCIVIIHAWLQCTA